MSNVPDPILHSTPDRSLITTSYRSPLAAARRQLFYCAGDPDLYHFSDAEFRLAIFLMYFAGWLCTKENRGAYDMQMLFPHPAECFKSLLDFGWIQPPDPGASLEHISIPQLKTLRAEIGLPPVKGNKAALVKALLNDAPPDVLNRYAVEHWYALPSSLGYHVLRSLYNERVDVELNATMALLQGRAHDAAVLVGAYRRRRPIFTQPSSYPDIWYPLDSAAECLFAVSRQYFSGGCITREYMEFFTDHADAVMHDSVKAFMYLCI